MYIVEPSKNLFIRAVRTTANDPTREESEREKEREIWRVKRSGGIWNRRNGKHSE